MKRVSVLLIVVCISNCFAVLGQGKVKPRWKYLGNYAIIELNFHYMPASTYLKSSNPAVNQNGSTSSIFGIDAGYLYLNYGNFNFGFGGGLTYSNYSSSQNFNYTGEVLIKDLSNEDLLITESAKLTENQQVSFIEMPLMFRLNYQWIDEACVYFNLGASFQYPIRNSYTSAGPYTRTGYYPALNMTVENEIYQPGTDLYFPHERTTIANGQLSLSYGISAITSFGYKRLIGRNVWAFGGLNFMYGLKNINASNGTKNFIISPTYNQYNSLTNLGSRISNFAYGVQLGLSVDFGKRKQLRRKTA